MGKSYPFYWKRSSRMYGVKSMVVHVCTRTGSKLPPIDFLLMFKDSDKVKTHLFSLLGTEVL